MPKENVGFEPTRRFPDLTVFKTDPFSRTWVYLRMITKITQNLIAAEGIEPPTSRV